MNYDKWHLLLCNINKNNPQKLFLFVKTPFFQKKIDTKTDYDYNEDTIENKGSDEDRLFPILGREPVVGVNRQEKKRYIPSEPKAGTRKTVPFSVIAALVHRS